MSTVFKCESYWLVSVNRQVPFLTPSSFRCEPSLKGYVLGLDRDRGWTEGGLVDPIKNGTMTVNIPFFS